MIKLNKTTLELSRDSLPEFLQGLLQDSLLDLSWADPELGLTNFAYYPEFDNSPVLTEHQSYGDEILLLDKENQRVIVTKTVIDWTDIQIADYERNKRKAQVPLSVTKRQGRQQLIIMGLIEQVQIAINAIQDPIQKALIQSYWDDSNEYLRHHEQMIVLADAIGLSDEELDYAFINASKL